MNFSDWDNKPFGSTNFSLFEYGSYKILLKQRSPWAITFSVSFSWIIKSACKSSTIFLRGGTLRLLIINYWYKILLI